MAEPSIGPAMPPTALVADTVESAGSKMRPKKKTRRDRREDLRNDGFKRSSGVDYSTTASRHMDDARFERAIRNKQGEAGAGAGASQLAAAAGASGAARSSTMEALVRMEAGLGEQTIAQKLADPNRPTWDQYKKDNEKALNISGNEIQSMIAYRQELDAARERELSRGTNHKKDSVPDKSRGKKHKKHKYKKKHKKKRPRADSSGSSESEFDSSEDDSDDARAQRHKHHKRHKKEKHRYKKVKHKHKRQKRMHKTPSEAAAEPVRLSDFMNQASSSESSDE